MVAIRAVQRLWEASPSSSCRTIGAFTARLIQCSHRYKMVGMLECACAPTHLYARVSVGPTGSAHTGRRHH